MSHFLRMQKGETPLRKDGFFNSGDTGGKDAGAANANPQLQPSVTSHLHSIADRHDNEADAHQQIAGRLSNLGLAARAGEHSRIASEHKVAAGHYRAAAAASEDTSDDAGVDVAKHLRAGREAAGHACELSKCMA